MQNSGDPGTRGYRRWKTADFSHSAGTAHGAPPRECPRNQGSELSDSTIVHPSAAAADVKRREDDVNLTPGDAGGHLHARQASPLLASKPT